MPSQINSPENFDSSAAAGVDRRTGEAERLGLPRWYIVIMLGLMLLGLAWLVVNYIAGPSIPLMVTLGPWNTVGFGLFIVGLLMTMGWK